MALRSQPSLAFVPLDGSFEPFVERHLLAVTKLAFCALYGTAPARLRKVSNFVAIDDGRLSHHHRDCFCRDRNREGNRERDGNRARPASEYFRDAVRDRSHQIDFFARYEISPANRSGALAR